MFKKIRILQISKVKQESKDVKTLTFNINSILKNHSINSYKPTPGEFLMIWVPGVDEIPMALSNYTKNGDWSITVKKVGECTEALFNLQKGDKIGIRGPFGKGFKIPSDVEKNCLFFIVGGGIGMCSLIPLISEMIKLEKKFIVIEGVKTQDEIIFRKYLEDLLIENETYYISTDDGSYGFKGFVTDLFNSILEKEISKRNKNIYVFCCGPEKMMYELFKKCEKMNISLQASLERMMRCGFGMCGLCVLDPSGIRICREGPVLDSKILRTCSDFGKYTRDFSGKKYKI
jgi:dihydroorotate dehydrogenase electron transfer subunit